MGGDWAGLRPRRGSPGPRPTRGPAPPSGHRWRPWRPPRAPECPRGEATPPPVPPQVQVWAARGRRRAWHSVAPLAAPPGGQEGSLGPVTPRWHARPWSPACSAGLGDWARRAAARCRRLQAPWWPLARRSGGPRPRRRAPRWDLRGRGSGRSGCQDRHLRQTRRVRDDLCDSPCSSSRAPSAALESGVRHGAIQPRAPCRVKAWHPGSTWDHVRSRPGPVPRGTQGSRHATVALTAVRPRKSREFPPIEPGAAPGPPQTLRGPAWILRTRGASRGSRPSSGSDPGRARSARSPPGAGPRPQAWQDRARARRGPRPASAQPSWRRLVAPPP